MIDNNDILPEEVFETEKQKTERLKLAKKYLDEHKDIDDSLSKAGLNAEQLQFFKEKIANREWRLNNLYNIRDKKGKISLLKLNRAQNKVLRAKHNRKVILKSRQTGISTQHVADNLDRCLFTPGFQAGIQSYGRDESAKLTDKAELMWELLDNDIKELFGLKLVGNNSSGMVFSNGSVLRIGNFRGDTLQSLHVSELAKIAKRYPEKAKELQSGAFEAVATDNIITIESTGEGPMGLFYEIVQRAITKKDVGVKLTPLDFELVFINWIDDDDCRLDQEVELTDEIVAYLNKVETELNIKLDDNQRWWYMAKYDALGSLIKQEYPTYPHEAFEMSLDGAYYSREYASLKRKDIKHDNRYKVIRAIDLGMSDRFVIGFFQIFPGIPPVMLAEYSNEGEGLDFYTEVCRVLARERGWVYGPTYVPHDVAVRELIAAKTRFRALQELGWQPTLVKKHRIGDGIEDTRCVLREITIDNSCVNTITAIQMYRKKYDKTFGIFLDAPEHDVNSHWADMLRYFSVGYNNNKLGNLTVAQSEIYRPRHYIGGNSFGSIDV